MNDFSNELYSGTPEEIDEERREQLLQEGEVFIPQDAGFGVA